MNLDKFQSEDIKELTQAVVKAQARIKPAKKTAENPFFHSKYADLSAVIEELKPFNEEGIAINQFPMPIDGNYILLDTQLSHISGQWFRSRLVMPAPKGDPQGFGSALSYARRYSLQCITGLPTADDDAQSASMKQVDNGQALASSESGPAKSLDAPAFIWRFGKWKNHPITEIEDQYLVWFRDNGKNEQHCNEARMELDRRQAQASFAAEDDNA